MEKYEFSSVYVITFSEKSKTFFFFFFILLYTLHSLIQIYLQKEKENVLFWFFVFVRLVLQK
jgi:hypothetical protein